MKHEGSRHVIKRMRVRMPNIPGAMGLFTTRLGEHGATFGEISTAHIGKKFKVRDVDILVSEESVFDALCDDVRAMNGIDLIGVTDVVQERHEGGKIEVRPRTDVHSADDLGIVYTPGVAAICRQIQADPELASRFTGIQNTVAIVTNGTAILGLGDIGAVAGMPVMEGKALLFSTLAGVSGIPILIQDRDPEVVIAAVRAIAPTFGAIKLEDISAPSCFEIEDRLNADLPIPVLHDDQHGTAVVVLAALLNIAKITYLDLRRSIIGIVGLGAAGAGIHKLLSAYGVQLVYGADINPEMNARFEARGGCATDLAGVMEHSDMVIATTGVPGLIAPEMVRPRQVILALSNPNPEIEPDVAIAAGAAFAADGRAVNNAMAFPGLFKGALSAHATTINDAMKIAAAKAIAHHALDDELIPDILDRSVHGAVADAVREAAFKTGVVRFTSHLEME